MPFFSFFFLEYNIYSMNALDSSKSFFTHEKYKKVSSSDNKFHFFLSLQLPLLPGFFPGTGSYPSQQRLDFEVFAFAFFVVFFLTISVLQSKKLLSDFYFISRSQAVLFSIPYTLTIKARAMPFPTQREQFIKTYSVLELLVFLFHFGHCCRLELFSVPIKVNKYTPRRQEHSDGDDEKAGVR